MIKLEYKYIESLGCRDCPRFRATKIEKIDMDREVLETEGLCIGPLCLLAEQFKKTLGWFKDVQS